MLEDFVDFVFDKEFNNIDFNKYFDYVEIKSCKFNNCKFNNGIFQGLDISDSTFKLCDISNVKLNDRSYKNIEFNNCREIKSQVFTMPMVSRTMHYQR